MKQGTGNSSMSGKLSARCGMLGLTPAYPASLGIQGNPNPTHPRPSSPARHGAGDNLHNP